MECFEGRAEGTRGTVSALELSHYNGRGSHNLSVQNENPTRVGTPIVRGNISGSILTARLALFLRRFTLSSAPQRRRHEHEHEYNYNQPQRTMTPFTMQELSYAINQLERSNEHSIRKVKTHRLRLYSKAISTKLAEHDDQCHIQERRPIGTIQISTHLFDAHLVQTLQPAPLQTSATHARRQPIR